MVVSEDKETTTEPLSEDQRLEEYKSDISLDADLVAEQRDQANEDMRFVNVDGGMWEGFLEDTSASSSERIRMQFDITSAPLNRYIGQWNQNRVGVEYKATDQKTSDEDAELLNGIYRAVFRDNSGKLATDNAVDEAATCGYGCMKIATRFVDDEDPENDMQEPEWRPIHNAYNSVIWDGNAKRIDKRDAMRCTELEEYTPESFKRAYPEEQPVSAYTPQSRSFDNWNVGNADVIYIATRYDIEKKKVSVFLYDNLSTDERESYFKEEHEKIKDELAEDVKAGTKVFVRERKIIRRSVWKTVFSGDAILKARKRIPGKYIPIIPFYGYRGFVDGVEWYRGMVRKFKDPNRLFNMQVSQLSETVGSGNESKPIFAPEQMANTEIQAIWADQVNKPYMLAEPLKDAEGAIIAQGPLAYTQPPAVDPNMAALMGVVSSYVQEISGGAPQDTIDPKTSGKAINAMRKREDLNTQIINDNIANAIEWSGEVFQAIAAEIYDTPRIVRTIGLDGTEGKKQLFQTVLDEESGKLIEANTLRGKKFKAYSDVGPQYDTLKEQTVEDLKGMLEVLIQVPSAQEYLAPILATLMDNIVGVGLGPLKELNRRNMLLQGLIKPETDEEKQLVAQAQEPQPDPQQELINAAANQANADAEKLVAEGRNLDSDSVDNIASAEKKAAETRKIQVETGLAQMDSEVGRVKSLLEIREQQEKRAQALPFNQVTHG